jgi:hypothetical protein
VRRSRTTAATHEHRDADLSRWNPVDSNLGGLSSLQVTAGREGQKVIGYFVLSLFVCALVFLIAYAVHAPAMRIPTIR